MSIPTKRFLKSVISTSIEPEKEDVGEHTSCECGSCGGERKLSALAYNEFRAKWRKFDAERAAQEIIKASKKFELFKGAFDIYPNPYFLRVLRDVASTNTGSKAIYRTDWILEGITEIVLKTIEMDDTMRATIDVGVDVSSLGGVAAENAVFIMTEVAVNYCAKDDRKWEKLKDLNWIAIFCDLLSCDFAQDDFTYLLACVCGRLIHSTHRKYTLEVLDSIDIRDVIGRFPQYNGPADGDVLDLLNYGYHTLLEMCEENNEYVEIFKLTKAVRLAYEVFEQTGKQTKYDVNSPTGEHSERTLPTRKRRLLQRKYGKGILSQIDQMYCVLSSFIGVVEGVGNCVTMKKSEERMKHCNWKSCRMEKRDFKCCARCKMVYYCSRECQKLDWKSHKRICASLK